MDTYIAYRVEETPALKDDPAFKLKYQETYLRLRRLVEKSASPEKEQVLEDLDKVYFISAPHLKI